jgi:hypothetical protein
MTSKRSARDFWVGLGLLGVVVVVALSGLASSGNWPKVIRVSLAASAYLGTLTLVQLVRAARRAETGPLPFVAFFAAGALAGTASGLLRPIVDPVVVVVAALCAGALLGGVHWLGLRSSFLQGETLTWPAGKRSGSTR